MTIQVSVMQIDLSSSAVRGLLDEMGEAVEAVELAGCGCGCGCQSASPPGGDTSPPGVDSGDNGGNSSGGDGVVGGGN